MTDKTQFLALTKSFAKFGSGICLARLQLAIEHLSLDAYIETTKKLVITGTNGKGSVAKLTNQILCGAGKSTGLFTSPHFLEFNERFTVNGELVDYAELNHAAQNIVPTLNKITATLNEEFGVFEFLYLVALTVFKHKKVELIIMEAGIGGRYDPIRLLKSRFAILTSVDLEHCDILGNTKELIAFDKIDGCEHGGKLVVGNIDEHLKSKVRAYAKLRDIQCYFNNDIQLNKQASAFNQYQVTLDDNAPFSITPKTFGKFAQENIKTAILMSEVFSKDVGFTISAEQYSDAINRFTNDGRLSLVCDVPKIFVDSAHTDESFNMLFDSIKQDFPQARIVVLAGISKGRDQTVLTARIAEVAEHCIVSKASFKGAEPALLQSKLKNHGLAASQSDDLKQAVMEAKAYAQAHDAIVFVCGGLFFAGEVSAILLNKSNEDIYLY
ncbi:hypothetical protein J8Z24_09620 [Pseudoalteromonas sp. SCSIO 43201]|uniref:glutamate ligase domain-containing protein n=1 Tax=Pseudoalteromonas TaxID=53246 RepID=UPI0020765A96|nr:MULTISPECIES: Mur ligase family protein [Pseudoalteromonas]MDW7548202.1 Mur ligase family protein [Pseudoalteromonas peptidolytica]USD27245.1 hypothetical protein J8Z24_09620 [Pseudoalteromonas sp. SCSIO 43201]